MNNKLMTLKNSSMKKILVIGLALVFSATMASADTVNVTSTGQGWKVISQNTFGLPADLTSIGCGVENETSCEPMGNFNFNVAFTNSGVVNIVDSNGAIGDQLVWGNGSNGLGNLTFKSDPSLDNLLPGGVTICVESNTTGCIGTFIITTAGGNLTIRAASDGESVFDPFGLGADSSDELQILGDVNLTTAPEPGSLALLGTGLVGLAGSLRRKLKF
jgi:hypothetical protein